MVVRASRNENDSPNERLLRRHHRRSAGPTLYLSTSLFNIPSLIQEQEEFQVPPDLLAVDSIVAEEKKALMRQAALLPVEL